MTRGGQEMSGELERYVGNAVDLIDAAAEAGLDHSAVNIMKKNLDKITLAGSQSSDLDSYTGETIVLVTLIIDESGSMSDVDQQIRDCYTRMISALEEKLPNSGIQLSTWVFSDTRKLLNRFRPILRVPKLFSKYRASGGTALYDTVLAALTSQVVLTNEIWERQKKVKNVVVVLSDGGDNASRKDRSGAQTKELAQTLIEQGEYILAYIGFGANEPLPIEQCRVLANKIGFNEIISVSKTENDMIRIFEKLVDSIVKVSTSTEVDMAGEFF